MKKDSKKDSGVSPVIGTILLVAITVVLVAIISAVVMGMTGNVGQTYTVGVKVSNDGSNTVAVFTGGDMTNLKGWKMVSSTNTTGTNDQYTGSKPSVGTPYDVGSKFTNETSIIGIFSTGNQTIWSGNLQ